LSLLTIAQIAADEIGLRRPASVVGNPDPEVQQLYRVIVIECEALLEAAYWQALRNERTFTAIAGETQTGILPSDFSRMVPETFWDRSNTRLVSAVQDGVQWQNLKAISYSGPQPKFVIRGGALSILPAMAGGESLAFEYITTNYILAADLTPKAAFTVDTDTTLLDEPLIAMGATWRYLARVGQSLNTIPQEYEQRRTRLIERDAPNSGTMQVADIFGGARTFSGTPSSGLVTNGY
jgi:hypothetical protein